MTILLRHLLPSEQFGAWKERNIHVPRRAKKIAEKNAALRNEPTEDYLKEHFCTKPFDTMESTDEGLVHMCCPDWLPTPIGTIDNLDKAWTGSAANRIRKSIVDGSFKYCSHLDCALISSRSLMRRDSPKAKALTKQFVETKTSPPARELVLSHDRSCNLSCPSCRTKTIVVGKDKQKRLNDLVEDSFIPTLKKIEQVYVTGSGDPFGSAHFRHLIKRLKRDEFPDLAFHLHSNAQLWDQRAWNDLDLAGRVTIAEISIDAAEPDTYSIVRRGGTFDRLLKNLAFIKSLRDAGEIKCLMFSMVVQNLNYRQMPAFVRLGKAHSADSISFHMIRNWGTYAPEEFEKIYIGRKHPDFGDLVEVLKDPELHQDGVDIGNIQENVRMQMRRAA